jgi:hypothetical protein
MKEATAKSRGLRERRSFNQVPEQALSL